MKKLFLILALGALIAFPTYAGTLTINNPNGGSLCLNTHYLITWTASGITTPVKLALRKNGALVGVIVENIAVGTTQYDWVVGQYVGGTASAGTGYSIRVRTQDNGVYGDGTAFGIKFCLVGDPHRYLLAQKIICRFPGPGCPGCPPEFDLNKLREQIGNPTENLRLMLFKNGAQILELGSFGKGRGLLPNSVKGKLSEADLGLLKNGKAQFSLGLLGADNKLRGTYGLQVQ